MRAVTGNELHKLYNSTVQPPSTSEFNVNVRNDKSESRLL